MSRKTKVHSAQQHQGGGGKTFTPQNRHGNGSGKKDEKKGNREKHEQDRQRMAKTFSW